MKKLIALLLAVSTMAISTSAFAYTDFELHAIGEAQGEHDGVSRNYAPSSSTGTVTVNGVATPDQANWGSPLFRSTDFGLSALPTYRAGDVLTFAVKCNEGTVADGEVFTFICSMQDYTDYTNYTVQFVDQIELTAPTSGAYSYFTYKLRDTLADGRYKLDMNLNGIVKTFSFLIGTPSVELLYVNQITDGTTPTKADKYFLRNGDAYCFGKATITGGANFSQVDTDFGFTLNRTNYYIKETSRNGNDLTADAQAALQASLDNGNNQEIGGQAQYFFRMVIEDVYDIDDTELTDDQIINIYNSLPDVDVYLNE